MEEDFLHKKLNERREQGAYRQLRLPEVKTDFSSNDYLGIVKKDLLTAAIAGKNYSHGSTGSRLLTGNSLLAEQVEKEIATFHDADAALLFNSGYDANLGLLSSVPQRGDLVLYDYLCHASIRDGIRLCFAESVSFRHNDIDDLERKLQKPGGRKFVVTESVFSMDGDIAPLKAIADLCESNDALLIVDEAHATGVVGARGEGVIQELGLQHRCFARIHTFGKALGCHGAVILGSDTLRNYLINFSRAFIYTTALPESSIAAIGAAYSMLEGMVSERNQLQNLISKFRELASGLQELPGNRMILQSSTPIQGLIVPGNKEVKELSKLLIDAGLDLRPILYPTVPKGSERLRIVLHSYNTMEEVGLLMNLIS